MSVAAIENLPDEILEYILYLLPPYEDIKNCCIVNKKWNRMASNIISRTQQNFGDALSSQNVTVEFQPSSGNCITKRYAHSACRHHDSMYIFGGFTSSFSSFNDLWKLDLSSRIWTRIRPEGKCPMPKAGATMVTFENKLVLFGGMLPHAQTTLFQTRRLSNDVHIFDIARNTWEEMSFKNDILVPCLARHSATIHNHQMVVFGGLQERCCADDLHLLDLRTAEWQHVVIHGEKPSPRFGHSQIFIDDTHLLILGGINTNSVIFDDAWLLDMSCTPWRWSKIDLGANISLIRSIWCHPVCKVGKFIVIFKPTTSDPSMYADWFPIPITRCSDPILPTKREKHGEQGILTSRSLRCGNAHAEEKSRSNALLPNIHQLRSLYRPMLKTSVELQILDTSHLLEDSRLVFVRNKLRPLNCPSDTILYSVVEGNGELIVFGGIERNICQLDDGNREIVSEIMNTLKIIKVKKKVI